MSGLIGLFFIMIIYSFFEAWSDKIDEKKKQKIMEAEERERERLRHFIGVFMGKIKH